MLVKKQKLIDIFLKNNIFINFLIPFLIIILRFMTFVFQKKLPMQIPFKLMT